MLKYTYIKHYSKKNVNSRILDFVHSFYIVVIILLFKSKSPPNNPASQAIAKYEQ